MPGKHSPEKLRARRKRALERGYCIPRNPDLTFIEVPTKLACRAKSATKALVVHDKMNSVTGKPFHFAAEAVVAARPLVGEAEFVRARSIIKDSNGARHDRTLPADAAVQQSWCEITEHEDLSLSSPLRGAQAAAEVCSMIPSSPPCGDSLPRSAPLHDVSTQTYESVLRPGAPDFQPSGCDVQPHALPDPVGCWYDPYAELFEVQNRSLALLCGRLDECMPSQKRLRASEKRLSCIESSVETLRHSMSATIDAKLKVQPYVLKAEVCNMISATRTDVLKDASDEQHKCWEKSSLTLTASILESQKSIFHVMLDEVKKYVVQTVERKISELSPLLPPEGGEPLGPAAAPAPPLDGTGDTSRAVVSGRPLDSGDVVRLTGVDNPSYKDKIATIIRPPGKNERVSLRILPNGPEIRVLPEKIQSPATCRMCGERIHAPTCSLCLTPADYTQPRQEADAYDSDFHSPPMSGDDSPSSSGINRSRSPAPAQGATSPKQRSSRPSRAELARRLDEVRWTT